MGKCGSCGDDVSVRLLVRVEDERDQWFCGNCAMGWPADNSDIHFHTFKGADGRDVYVLPADVVALTAEDAGTTILLAGRARVRVVESIEMVAAALGIQKQVDA